MQPVEINRCPDVCHLGRDDIEFRKYFDLPPRRCSATRSIARLCFAGARLSSADTRILVSKKLRAFMDFVAMEAPTARNRRFPKDAGILQSSVPDRLVRPTSEAIRGSP